MTTWHLSKNTHAIFRYIFLNILKEKVLYKSNAIDLFEIRTTMCFKYVVYLFRNPNTTDNTQKNGHHLDE